MTLRIAGAACVDRLYAGCVNLSMGHTMAAYLWGLFLGAIIVLAYFLYKRCAISFYSVATERHTESEQKRYRIFDRNLRKILIAFSLMIFIIIMFIPPSSPLLFEDQLRPSVLRAGWDTLSSSITRPALWLGLGIGAIISLWFYAAVVLEKTQIATAGIVGFIALGGTLMALDERYGFLEKLQSFEAAGTKLTFAAVSTSASDRRTPQFVNSQQGGATQGVQGRFAYALATVGETNEAFGRDLMFARMMLGMFRGGLRGSDREEPRLDATQEQRTSHQQAIANPDEIWRSAQQEVTKQFDYGNTLFYFTDSVLKPLLYSQEVIAALFRSDHTTTLFNHDIIHTLHEIYREKYRDFLCDTARRGSLGPFDLAERSLQDSGRSTLEANHACAGTTVVEANSPSSPQFGTRNVFETRRNYQQSIIDSFKIKLFEHIQRVCLLQGMHSDTRQQPIVSDKVAGGFRRNISFYNCAAAHAQPYDDWEIFPSANTVYFPTIVAMAYFVVGLDEAALHVMEEWLSHLDLDTMLNRLRVLRGRNTELLLKDDNEEMLSIAFRLAMYSRALHVISSISTYSHERSIIQSIRHAHAARAMDRIMLESPVIAARLGQNLENIFVFCSNQSNLTQEEENFKRVILSQLGSMSRLLESAVTFDVARVSAYANFINARAELLSSPERLRDCMASIRRPTGRQAFERDQIQRAVLSFQVAYTRATLAGAQVATLASQDRRQLLCRLGRRLTTLIAPIDLSLAVANPNNAREVLRGLSMLPAPPLERNPLAAAYRFDDEREARGLLASLRRESGSQRDDFSDC